MAFLEVTRDCTVEMDPKHSTLNPYAKSFRPQTNDSFNQLENVPSHKCLEQLLFGCKTDCQKLLLQTGQELGRKIHEAISQRDTILLWCLVRCHEARLEQRNEQGLTPLYMAVYSNWLDGALLLLTGGADVHKAESRPQNLCFSYKPLMHLAMKTGREPLVRALIKKGASIRVKDFQGESCVSIHPPWSPNDLFECLADSLTEEGSSRTDLLKDMLFVISTAAQLGVNRQQVEKFIKRQPSRHRGKMFQVFAASLCIASSDAAAALCYWKMSVECTPCQPHDLTQEEEMGLGSFFADILDVRKHPLPDTVTTDEDKLAIHIHALLAIEQCIPEDNMLVQAGEILHKLLIDQGNIVTALGVLSRLTTIRLLYKHEVSKMKSLLSIALEDSDRTKELPISAIIDSMKIIQSCLSSLNVSCTKALLFGAPSNEDNFDITQQDLFLVLIQTMKYYYGQAVLATSEQLQDFSSQVKDFLERFPSSHCQNAFHLLAHIDLENPSTASMIKDLVAYSAEVRGKVHQKQSPLHLLSDEDGNTPLHCLARCRSQEDLVQGGVLQCFLDHGADLCSKNYQGETVRSILVRRGVFTEGELLPSLQCLAAAAFMGDRRLSQTIPNCRPAAVRNFLLDHRAYNNHNTNH